MIVVFQMVGAQENSFAEIAGTFSAQPGSLLIALMAGRIEHLVAGQQADRVLGYRFALGRTQYFDVGFRAGAEVV